MHQITPHTAPYSTSKTTAYGYGTYTSTTNKSMYAKNSKTGSHPIAIGIGARYLDSELSVWLSVDPLADKYPSLSPYMYTAGNPVIFVDPDGRAFGPPDWEKCVLFGGFSFKRIKKFVRRLFWHKTVTSTYVKGASSQSITPRWNRGTRKNIRIRGEGKVVFETKQIEDQLIIIDKKTGKVVVNSGSVATDNKPETYSIKAGKYKLKVKANTNPSQRRGTTFYNVDVNDQATKVKKVKVKKLWGIIPYSRKVNKTTWRPKLPNTSGKRRVISRKQRGF
jgi:RHS repeat-associated protein